MPDGPGLKVWKGETAAQQLDGSDFQENMNGLRIVFEDLCVPRAFVVFVYFVVSWLSGGAGVDEPTRVSIGRWIDRDG